MKANLNSLTLPTIRRELPINCLVPQLNHNSNRLFIPRQTFSSANSTPYFKDFHNLDAIPAAKAQFLLNSMIFLSQQNSIIQIKENAIDSMLARLPNLNSSHILEVGCGHGIDAELIAKSLPQGSIMAIDSSSLMIDMAKRCSKYPNVKYETKNVNLLYQEGWEKSFDGCHADRLLVSSLEYKALFNNVLKLIKPGGVITFTDVDASSILISPDNTITSIIREELLEGFVNRDMGQQLAGLFAEYQLTDIKVVRAISKLSSFDQLSKVFDFTEIIQAVVSKQKISQAVGEHWLKDMQKASQTGNFSYCVTFYTVSGTVPL